MEETEGRVRSHSIKYIAQCGQRYLVGMLLLPPVTLYVIWQHVPWKVSFSWFVASYLVAWWRYVLIARVRRISTEDINPEFWGRQLTLSSFASGILWGLAAVLFFVPDSLGVQLYLFLTVFVMASMTMILYAYWIAAYFAFMIPSLSGVFISLLSVGSTEYYAFSVLTLLYAGVVFQVAKSQRLLANDSLRLRFQKDDLLEQLRLQKEAAEEANLSKSKFLAAASHDLRQPLHSIGLFTAALSNSTADLSKNGLIDNIDSAVLSLDNLLSSLLDISKLDAGVISPRLEHIEMGSTLRRMALEYEPQARAKNLSWGCKISSAVAHSDTNLLDTILRNLISNAIRYTDNGSIDLQCEEQNGAIILRVVDTGVGIPAVQQKEVFREFYQLSNPGRDSDKGVGLGLAMVERLSNLLNIRIGLTSKPGEGTEFSLRIPLGDQRRVNMKGHTDLESPHDGAGALVMVIDNNPEVLVAMKALLKSWKYKALCVSSERGALRAIRLSGIEPSILMSDYQLEAGVTGVEVLNSLSQKLSAPFDAIILTGDTSKKCFLDAQNNDYRVLHKPVAPAKLRAMLIQIKLKNRAAGH